MDENPQASSSSNWSAMRWDGPPSPDRDNAAHARFLDRLKWNGQSSHEAHVASMVVHELWREAVDSGRSLPTAAWGVLAGALRDLANELQELERRAREADRPSGGL